MKRPTPRRFWKVCVKRVDVKASNSSLLKSLHKRLSLKQYFNFVMMVAPIKQKPVHCHERVNSFMTDAVIV